MTPQWQCIRQNIGTWHGSFTQFSPNGKQLKDVPSILTLEETEPGKKMQLTLKRFSERKAASTSDGNPPNVVTKEFSYPGPAPYVYFFETGAFSQGSSQWAAFCQFGAEMSIKVGKRRVRFVIMYDGTTGGTSELKYVTLIRETHPDGTPFDEPQLKLKQILAHFKGEISLLHADMSPMTTGHSEWKAKTTDGGGAELNKAEYEARNGRFAQELFLSSTRLPDAEISQEPIFLEGNLTYQLMILPNGAYCLIPRTIEKNVAFQVEVGWLSAEGDRSRLIRYYDAKGTWTDSALIVDCLVS